MKVIPLHNNEKRLLKKALKDSKTAQKALYDRHAPKMLSVCRMYIKDTHHAEEVMLDGFFKVFTKLKSFRSEGSFEGWVRRIMVREAISFLRKQKDNRFLEENIENSSFFAEDNPALESETDYIQELIDDLPAGYRMVFMMYAVEGYKHHEIADLLNISEGTSKSQLSKARKILQEKLKGKRKERYGAE